MWCFGCGGDAIVRTKSTRKTGPGGADCGNCSNPIHHYQHDQMVWILWTMKFKSLIQRPSDEGIISKIKRNLENGKREKKRRRRKRERKEGRGQASIRIICTLTCALASRKSLDLAPAHLHGAHRRRYHFQAPQQPSGPRRCTCPALSSGQCQVLSRQHQSYEVRHHL